MNSSNDSSNKESYMKFALLRGNSVKLCNERIDMANCYSSSQRHAGYSTFSHSCMRRRASKRTKRSISACVGRSRNGDKSL